MVIAGQIYKEFEIRQYFNNVNSVAHSKLVWIHVLTALRKPGVTISSSSRVSVPNFYVFWHIYKYEVSINNWQQI
jgi:hypothetical protein